MGVCVSQCSNKEKDYDYEDDVMGQQRPNLLPLTLMYSMGHTAVASMPPAMQPADMASRGFFFWGWEDMV